MIESGDVVIFGVGAFKKPGWKSSQVMRFDPVYVIQWAAFQWIDVI